MLKRIGTPKRSRIAQLKQGGREKNEIEVVWEPFNEYTISSTSNITLATLSIMAGLQSSVQILGEQVSVKCLAIEAAGFVVTTTDQGRLHSLQIDGQSRSPGLLSLREAIATTCVVAVWLAQLPGFPSARPTEDEIDHRPVEGTEGTESGDDSDEVIDLTSPNERGSDVDEDISDDGQGNPDMPSKGWTGKNTQAKRWKPQSYQASHWIPLTHQ